VGPNQLVILNQVRAVVTRAVSSQFRECTRALGQQDSTQDTSSAAPRGGPGRLNRADRELYST
jgi:hypothetical protein